MRIPPRSQSAVWAEILRVLLAGTFLLCALVMGCSSSSNERFACSTQSLSSHATHARGDTFPCIRRPSGGPHARGYYSVLRGALHNLVSEGGSPVVTCDFSVRPGELVRGSTPQHQIPVNAFCVAGPAPHSFAFIEDVCHPPNASSFRSARVGLPSGEQSPGFSSGPPSRGHPALPRRLRRTHPLNEAVSRHEDGGSGLRIGYLRNVGPLFSYGGASQGTMHGMSEMQFEEAGRWQSRTVRRYVRWHVSVLHVT